MQTTATLRTSQVAATATVTLAQGQKTISVTIAQGATNPLLTINGQKCAGILLGSVLSVTPPDGVLVVGKNTLSLSYTLPTPITMAVTISDTTAPPKPTLPESPTDFKINTTDNGPGMTLNMSWTAAKGADSHVMHMAESMDVDPDSLPPIQAGLGTTFEQIVAKSNAEQMRIYCPAGVNSVGTGPCSDDVMVLIPALAVTPNPPMLAEPPSVRNLRIKSAWVGGKVVDSLAWDTLPGATEYKTYGYGYLLGTSTAPTFTIPANKNYPGITYTVTAIVGGMESNPSALSYYGVVPDTMGSWDGALPETIANLTGATFWDSATACQSLIVWTNPVDINRASQLFNVWRDGVLVCPGISRLYYVDTNVVPGKSYKYEIEALGLYKAAWSISPKVAITVSVPSVPPTFYKFGGTVPAISGITTIPNDDSAIVTIPKAFSVPGARDYRAYIKGGNSYKYAGLPIADATGKPLSVDIEVNNLDPAKVPYTLVVEALDRLGPFQAMDGTMPPGHMDGMPTHTNGQGDPSNRPVVLARSEVIVSALVPFKLTGSQVFFDNFRGSDAITQTNRDAAKRITTFESEFWRFKTFDADNANTRLFIMNKHFMDTLYDGDDVGPNPGQGPAHNNIATMMMEPKSASADISGGKTLHVTMEVDARFNGRRWCDIGLRRAEDTVINPAFQKIEPPGAVTKSGDLLLWEIMGGVYALEFTRGDGTNTGKYAKRQPQIATDWQTDPVLGTGREGWVDRSTKNESYPYDRRVRFDLYVSETWFAFAENGVVQVSRPLTEKLPFTKIVPFFSHHLYHTGNDQTEVRTYDQVRGAYWYNHRPFSDERHWDNMGFEVLDKFPFGDVNPLVPKP